MMKSRILLAAAIAGVVAAGPARAAMADDNGDPRQNRFERLDENGDGRVDKAEFANGGAKRFDSMDANADGVVTMAEFEEFDRRQRIERRFRRMDADGDGFVTEAEFAAIGDGMFDRLDTNADGFLTTDDMRHRRHGGRKSGAADN